MPKQYEGRLDGSGLRMALVVGRFNSFISERLVDGALDALLRHGVADDDISVARVPGAFEIPLVARKMAESGKFDAVICLGRSSVDRRRILTMSAPRFPRASQAWDWPAACRLFLAC